MSTTRGRRDIESRLDREEAEGKRLSAEFDRVYADLLALCAKVDRRSERIKRLAAEITGARRAS